MLREGHRFESVMLHTITLNSQLDWGFIVISQAMYYTYIIYSSVLERYYIGQCENIDIRIMDHNNSRSTYTKKGKPWVLRWSKAFPTRAEAIVFSIKTHFYSRIFQSLPGFSLLFPVRIDRRRLSQ